MRKDVVVSRDVRFDEGVPGSQMATVIEEQRIIYNSITVLPGPRPMEHLESDKENSISDDRVHVCGNIVRLGQRNNPSSFFGIKGHVVFLPQNTTRLIDLLPMSPASLSDMVKVVWTGKSKPDRSRLRSRFLVRKHKVYNALKWL